jgi:signal transduction histidine kinase
MVMDRWRIEAGMPSGVAGSLNDISELKLLQEKILQLESRLRQAERFEAMGTLASGAAHDLNNILGAILGFGERALRAAEAGSRLQNDLGNIVAAGERGRHLVDCILSFGRGGAVERAPVHVESVISEALNLLQVTLPRAIRLRSRLHASNASILGDAGQIHQLVMNLGTNAAHAMTQAGTLTVSLKVLDVRQARRAKVGALAAGPWIMLQVADQGGGMTPEILEQIFDPFFTTKESGVGKGLGLWQVLRIVTQAGGAIDIESIPVVGSVFTVYLPRAGDAPEESLNARQALPNGRAERVTVMDDEQALL